MVLAMVMLLSISGQCACAAESIDTTSRGYQLINGDVYDLNGNLLIKMYDGFTGDGYTLDPNFKVYYPSNDSEAVDKNVVLPMSTDLFNGTKDLPLNTDGNQGTYLCNDFTVSSSEPDVWCKYSSGVPSGVNFAVLNITRNTAVGWVPNLQAGRSDTVDGVYNSARPNDHYAVKASAQGSAGSAKLQVKKQ